MGDIGALICDGAVRDIRYRGIEVVRSVDCPVRDENWATSTPQDVSETLSEGGDAVRFARDFTVFGGQLACRFAAEFRAQEVRISAELSARERILTNRAGLTLLHPIRGVSGTDLTIRHSDRTEEATRFPDRVMPGQPAFDIAGLDHGVHGIAVRIAFHGEVFEMEDQRNWTDASYKTYCRPLALPTPDEIAAGETVRQAITIRCDGQPVASATAAVARPPQCLPEVALAAEPEWWGPAAEASAAALLPGPVLLRLEAERVSDLPAVGTAELEVVTSDTGDLGSELQGVAAAAARAGVAVSHVSALPRAYLRSYQPTAVWPDGTTPEDAAAAAKAAFPDARIGLGMLTNFTEFNRCPPQPGVGTYTTYSTTALVHAGDDRSVLETLDALADVHASAAHLSGDRPRRLGLATIGMRTNPYGAGVVANPSLERIAMAQDDPRQRTVFGAAFALGAYTQAAMAGVRRIALAGLGGPFATGEFRAGCFGAWPIHHVIRALRDMAGATAVSPPDLPPGTSAIFASAADGTRGIVANTSLSPVSLMLPGHLARHLGADTDASAPDWLDTAPTRPADDLSLEPMELAFVTRGDGP